MFSRFSSIQLILLVFACNVFLGCSQTELTQKEKTSTNQNQQEKESKTVTVEQPQKKTKQCSQTPGKLNPSNVEKITLNEQETTVSGQLTAGEALGYSFEGNKNQRLTYNTKDEFCMWIYTPNNDLLQGVKLPKDGLYTVQISIPKGAKTFELSMSLKQPKYSKSSKETTRNSVAPIGSNENSVSPSETNQESVNREKALDNLADQIFYKRHPELNGREIKPHETALIQEWKAIRNCEAIVDYRFYQKHPELQGQKIQEGETQLAQEWLSIKRRVPGCN